MQVCWNDNSSGEHGLHEHVFGAGGPRVAVNTTYRESSAGDQEDCEDRNDSGDTNATTITDTTGPPQLQVAKGTGTVLPVAGTATATPEPRTCLSDVHAVHGIPGVAADPGHTAEHGSNATIATNATVSAINTPHGLDVQTVRDRSGTRQRYQDEKHTVS